MSESPTESFDLTRFENGDGLEFRKAGKNVMSFAQMQALRDVDAVAMQEKGSEVLEAEKIALFARYSAEQIDKWRDDARAA